MIMRLLIIIGCCAFLSTVAAAAERNIWIDADPACGLGKTDDVDDCWAIIAAMRSSRLNVVGISTVFGNVSLNNAEAVARNLLTSIGTREPALAVPPLHRGAAEPIHSDFVIPSAVGALESALTERPLTILALGPLTNIAMLLRNRPDLAHRIKAIVAVGGQRPGQVFKVGSTPILHFHDLNVRKDPDAFDIILRSGVSIHLVPFEVGRQAKVTRADLNFLETNGKLDRWIGKRSRAWLSFWEHMLGASGFSPFDTVAVAYLVEPRNFLCETMPAKIVRRRGLFVVRDSLEVAPSIRGGNLVTYCWGLSRIMRNSITEFVSNPNRTSWIHETHFLHSAATNRTR